ncbi:MAG: S53 family peptidase, partial [Ktedonobacteraceae bacterium]
KLVGPADTNQTISLAVSLNLRNQTALNTYLSEVTQPKSTVYHRYLSQAAFIGAFSPTQAEQSAVVNYLQQVGFSVKQTYKSRLLIDFTGTIGLAERVFNVQINNYTAPGGRAFYSSIADPVMPSTISSYVQGIIGLDNAQQYQRMSTLTRLNSGPNAPAVIKNSPNTSCLPENSSYYIPSQIATAYDLTGLHSAGDNGEGQTVALYELSQFQESDVTNFDNCYGQSHTPIIVTTVDGGAPPPSKGDNGGAIETETDAELVLSAAPKLGQLRIYEAPDSGTGPLDEWQKIVNDDPAVVSTSWGDCELNGTESEALAEAAFFKQAAAQGESIFAASADSGSAGCYAPSRQDFNTNLSVDDPASQPFITAAGGTNLTVANSSGTYASENVWNDQVSNNGNNPQGGATGGGISKYWQMPSWQTGPGVISQYSSGSPCGVSPGYCREVPDVALHAGTQIPYLFYCTVVVEGCSGGTWFGISGTSCAAPMWAAITAMINEMSVKNGGFNMGFLNPLLYQIASGSNYSRDFHDVTSGENDWNNLNGGRYPATANYDMATGLGSPDAYNLAQDLIALNGQRAPTPANTQWYFAEGAVGGDFAEYLTLQNPSPTQDATVTVTYELQNHNPSTIQKVYTVAHSTRVTVYVNGPTGVNIAPNGPKVSLAASISSTVPIVAERPMYFSFHGVNSGTDVVGATSLHTTYYFPYGNTTQSGSTHDSTYITMLNPSTTNTANVTLTYYTNSCGAS